MLIVWLSIPWLLAGCAAQPSPVAQRPGPVPASRHRLWSVVDTLAVSRPAALARYGPPVAVRGDTARNFNFPERVDSIVYVQFRHFEANYVIHPDRRVTLRHITVSAPIAALPPQVRPGSNRDSVVAYLGAPAADEDFEGGRLLLFDLQRSPDGETYGNVLNVFLAGNRVRWISWVFEPELRLPD